VGEEVARKMLVLRGPGDDRSFGTAKRKLIEYAGAIK
jgi:hypothetical protein